MNEVADVMKSDPLPPSDDIFCSAPISEAPDSSSPVSSACLNGFTEEKEDRHLSMVSAWNKCQRPTTADQIQDGLVRKQEKHFLETASATEQDKRSLVFWNVHQSQQTEADNGLDKGPDTFKTARGSCLTTTYSVIIDRNRRTQRSSQHWETVCKSRCNVADHQISIPVQTIDLRYKPTLPRLRMAPCIKCFFFFCRQKSSVTYSQLQSRL